MLREFLPDALRNLDESEWQQKSAAERMNAAEEVVIEVRRALPVIRERIGLEFLPPPPQGLKLSDLDLEVRTVNCLITLGIQEDLQLIGRLNINLLMATRNFGVKSLVDLLTTLEHVGSQEWTPDLLDQVRQQSDLRPREVINGEDIRIVRECHRRKSSIPIQIRSRRLPQVPENLRLHKSDLRNRTYNCLERSGFIQRPQDLGGQTIDALLSLPTFGRESLVDLLTMLEPHIGVLEIDERQRDEAANELVVEAKLLEEMGSADLISAHDPRLGQLLRSISPEAQNALEAAERLLNGSHAPRDPAGVARSIRQFREQVEALTRITLEDELMSLLVGVRSSRNAEIFARRFGFDGREDATLQELGHEYGMTRERIRQICDGVERIVHIGRPFLPIFDKALDSVVKNLPGIASEIEAQFESQGIAKRPFRLESLQRIAKLLGRDIPYSLSKVAEQRTVMAEGAEYSANAILKVARRAIEHWGASTVEDVTVQASEKSAFPPDLVLRCIAAQEDFRWLDEQSGWFWLEGLSRNRLVNQIEKVLSVADAVDIGELRAGVRRHHRMEGIAPPQRVLLELCRQLPWCRVGDGAISASTPLYWRTILSEAELVMVEILKASGPAMRRRQLEEECLARGMNRATFYAYLNYSPVITKHARGVYGLRGVDVSDESVESLKSRVLHVGKVLKDFGWTPQGQPWVGYHLSENSVLSGVCTIPSSLTGSIEGEFTLKAVDGSLVGTLGTKNSSAWGLGPFFRRKGVEAGDYLVLVFDLPSRTAVAHLGDENLLDDFQSDVLGNPEAEQAIGSDAKRAAQSATKTNNLDHPNVSSSPIEGLKQDEKVERVEENNVELSVARDFMLYWRPETVDDNIAHRPMLTHAASNQLQRANPGDTLWIVTVRDGELFMVGRLKVAELTDSEGAKRRLGTDDLWDAQYHAIAADSNAETICELSLADIGAAMRFESQSNDRFVISDGKINAQQLQTMRMLTTDTAQMLTDKWTQTRQVISALEPKENRDFEEEEAKRLSEQDWESLFRDLKELSLFASRLAVMSARRVAGESGASFEETLERLKEHYLAPAERVESMVKRLRMLTFHDEDEMDAMDEDMPQRVTQDRPLRKAERVVLQELTEDELTNNVPKFGDDMTQEPETLTQEEMDWISRVSSDPNLPAAERRKMEKLLETKKLPEGVVELFSELADEATDVGD